ncbi:MAG: VCBS repeat-containing protein [Acidobacteria bacterium]|nr:VCBS repeat-containing protein [Acidobacteriota bacterium]
MLSVPILLLRFTASCVLVAQYVEAQPQFLRKEIRIGQAASPFVLDVNGDSRPDIVFSGARTTRGPQDTTVLLNTGGGDFSSPIVSDGCVIQFGVAGDFNRDGKLDLASARWSTAPPVPEICYGRGDSTFLPSQRIEGVSDGVPLASGDFDADGKPDLVLARNGFLEILLGQGDGTFRQGSAVSAWRVVDVHVADFNADGLSDLAVLPNGCPSTDCSSFNRILIFLGQGDGSFREPVEISVFLAPATLTCCPSGGLVVSDFNRDGRPDIATSSALLLGKGDGRFQAAQSFDSSSLIYGQFPVAAADLDGDGHLDLVMHTGYEGEGVGAYILFGQGDGAMRYEKYASGGSWLDSKPGCG